MLNGGYSMLMTFDGRAKRGSIFYDSQCSPDTIKVSNGFGEVTMYYYKVVGDKLNLIKTQKNTYRK